MHNDFIFLPYSDIYLLSLPRLNLHKKNRYRSFTNLYDNRYLGIFIICFSKRGTSQIALINGSTVSRRVILQDIVLST